MIAVCVDLFSQIHFSLVSIPQAMSNVKAAMEGVYGE
jgi:hypothetical protein